jgi:integrase
MPKGERGTSRPYLRGKTWWIRNSVPGEAKERFESSRSTNKNDAVRLLNWRRKQIDDRQVTRTTTSICDLQLYLDDQKRRGHHSYKQAEGYVRLHRLVRSLRKPQNKAAGGRPKVLKPCRYCGASFGSASTNRNARRKHVARGEKGTSKPYLRGRIWWIRYQVPGEEKERFESSKSRDKEIAKRLLRERLNAIDDRKIVTVDPAKNTIGHLLDLYLQEYDNQGYHSKQQADGYVRLHLRPAFGNMRIDQIRTQHIKSFIKLKKQGAGGLPDKRKKREGGYKAATINRWLEALQKSFELGYRHLPPLVFTDPATFFRDFMLDKEEAENVREGFMSHEEYIRLRNELPDHQKLMLVIAYHYGMRRGEILNLRWDQVEWDGRGQINLERKQTKAKQPRIAKFYGQVRQWLEMAREMNPDSKYIVAYRGAGIDEYKTAWKKARERAGIPEVRLHDLRRTAARNMRRAGVSEKEIMSIVGWKTRAMFDRYNIIDESDREHSAQKLDRFAEEQEIRTLSKVRTVEEGEDPEVTDNPLKIQ